MTGIITLCLYLVDLHGEMWLLPFGDLDALGRAPTTMRFRPLPYLNIAMETRGLQEQDMV